jgi:lysophospholipase L1-like esterase
MLRRLTRAVRLVIALPLVGALVAGCTNGDHAPAARTAHGDGYVGRPGAPRVAVVGDSITALTRARIVPTLAHRYRVRVNAFSGRTIAEVTPAIVAQVATDPDVEVVNLGTNDMDRGGTNWRADLDRMLGIVATVPCVEIFTIYDGRHRPAGANVGTQINARLRAAAATGSVRLIDWNAAVHRDPNLVVDDGIHPGTAGQRWIATSMRDAIRADC